MQYPLISEYINAILNAEDNFATRTDLRPVLNDDGRPVMTSGNFAVVFKMKDERDGKMYAVKCFTREQEGRAENYRMIADELGKVSSPYITPVKWLDDELFVDTKQTDETEFPVLLMDWIEGPTLSAFLQSIAYQLAEGKVFKDNEYEMFELRCLPANFLRMASWLLKQPFVHGDLKPDNIIVQEDGYCVLVDYDGMFVPAMQGMLMPCMGTPNFTHPSQESPTLNKDIDNYAISVIALSLQVFSMKPSMIAESTDYCVIPKQQALKPHTLNLLNDENMMTNNNFQSLLSLFLHILSQNKLDVTYFDQIIAEILVPKDFDIYNTEVKDEDLENCYTDKYGVRYSIDGRRALKRSSDISSLDYYIREGTSVLCDSSFQSCNLHRIHLPESVLSIGKVAFANNYYMTHCNIPQSVINICDNNPWGGCFNITYFKCESPRFLIENGILYSADYRIAYGFIYWREDVRINKKTKTLASNAFWSGRLTNDKYNFFIKSIDVANVHKIGTAAFLGCKSIKSIDLANIKTIGEEAFSECDALESVTLSNSITEIEKDTFCGCHSIASITIPSSVTSIGDCAFSGCYALQSISIPASVTHIGYYAFEECKGLINIFVDEGNQYYSSSDGVLFNKERTELLLFPRGKMSLSYEIPSSVICVDEEAFKYCNFLHSISIPDSVTNIDFYQFWGGERFTNIYVDGGNKHYSSLDGVLFNKEYTKLLSFPRGKHATSYVIPSSVKSIGIHAFSNCKALRSIVLSNSIIDIEEGAFWECESLESITLPTHIKHIGEFAFLGCKSLKSIKIPASVTNIDDNAFVGCDSLINITIPKGEYDRMKSLFPKELQKLIVEQ